MADYNSNFESMFPEAESVMTSKISPTLYLNSTVFATMEHMEKTGSGYCFNSGSGSGTSGKGSDSSTSRGGIQSRLKKKRTRISGLRLPTEGRHLASQLLN